MKVFQVSYFTKGLQTLSIVVARNEEKAVQVISKTFNGDDDFELDRICEYELTAEQIIHTEVIEIA